MLPNLLSPAAPAVSRRRLVLAVSLAVASLPALAAPAPAPAPEPATLDEVVVTASGFEQVIREAPASISIITREQLETKPWHGLAEALADVEGIDVGAAVDKTGAPSISIRGMPSDYTLILVDGRRQNAAGNVTPNNFGGTANNFIPPLSAIQRIEVIRGPMSTLYGSDAMGGVVNIITRKVGSQWSGALALEGTLQQDNDFGDMSGGNVYAAGPLGKAPLGLSVWGGWFKRGAADVEYLDQGGDTVVPWMGANPVAYENFNLGARLSLMAGDNHDLWLEATRGRQRYDNSAGQVGTLGSGGYAPVQRYHRDQLTLAWTARLGIGTLETTLMDSTTETIGRLVPPGVPGAGSPRTLETTNTVFDAKLVTGVGDHTFSVGGQYWDAGMEDGVAPGSFAFEQWALFAEDEWTLRDDLKLTLGLRHDEHSSFGGHASPRAYLVWNASERWVLKGGISQGYKTPRVEQLTDGINGFGGQGRIPLIGTPDLKPETSTTSEIGLYYAGASGMSASFGLFHNDFQDKIARGVPVFNCSFAASPDRPGCVDVGYWPLVDTFGQSINIDEAVTRGAELGLTLPFAERWEWVANYTWTDSEQKSGDAAGQPLADTPRHMFNTSLHWDATDALSLSLRGEYRSERYRGAGAAQDQLGDFRAYSLLHLSSTWRISDTVRLNAAIYNLADKDFVDYRPYVSNAGTGAVSYANTYVNSEDGRRLWLSLNVDF
ncbi:TonB-dependent receptor domain-containing protein [Arenimonas caeni]|jgi:outer membrane receptor for ferrienterochelin and colicins|uniref:TonB-dependent receptor n=1 Tax=Arenimonas caeni TaxID=2058085 RepID=A0A2P6M6Y7_9GAMM|nr:TonB-dependent receptor [Arenimonas caeni]MDY0020876.1 TonB-dependent receptor [Arenimonas caeni]PRH81729.1 TonB-dependent receptor [Arenimonas caeni]